jgi:hypothetical protein
MTSQLSESEVLAHAEELVAQVEADTRQLARSLLARVFEIAEDLWAEAQSARGELRADV